MSFGKPEPMNTDKIPFPHKMLKGQFALLSPLADVSAVQLSVSLQAFELDNEIHHLIIDATLNDVLPSAYLRDVADLDLRFSRQENGWLNENDAEPERTLDASVYLFGRHQVIEIQSLKFCRNRAQNGLTLLLKGVLCFEYEGNTDYADTDFVLNMPVYSSAI